MRCRPTDIVRETPSRLCRKLPNSLFRKAMAMITEVSPVRKTSRAVRRSLFSVSASWWFTLFWVRFMRASLFRSLCFWVCLADWWVASFSPGCSDWRIIFICKQVWLCWSVCWRRRLFCWRNMLPNVVKQVWGWLLLRSVRLKPVCVRFWWRHWRWFSVCSRWWCQVEWEPTVTVHWVRG